MPSSNAPQIDAKPAPLVPEWAIEAANYINRMLAARVQIVSPEQLGSVGATAFQFSAENSVLFIPITAAQLSGLAAVALSGNAKDLTAGGLEGLSQTVTLAKITAGGANGSATFANGMLTAYTAPT